MVENPATSSPGLAFLLATIAHFGDDGWQDYWKQLRANGVKVVDGWDEAYDSDFTGRRRATGTVAVRRVVRVEPAADVVYAERRRPKTRRRRGARDSASARSSSRACCRAPTHAGGRASSSTSCCRQAFQDDMPLQMFVFPVRDGTPLPAVFTKFAGRARRRRSRCPPTRSARNRDEWIEEWTDTVLR